MYVCDGVGHRMITEVEISVARVTLFILKRQNGKIEKNTFVSFVLLLTKTAFMPL